MNLKELQELIKEEYDLYLEQGDDSKDDKSKDDKPKNNKPKGPKKPPSVTVSDKDVDVKGGSDEDAEATLKDIYDMLKDFFEGEEDAPKMDAPKMDAPPAAPGDMDMLQERFKKLANIIK